MSAKLTIQQIQQRIDRSPANRWLGITVLDLEDSGITLQMPVRAEMTGNPDTRVLHGGFMGCLIDTACSFAVIAQTGESVVTIDLSVDFHEAQRSPLLVATASVLRIGRRIASTEVRVTEADGRLVASGRAVFANVPFTPHARRKDSGSRSP
ncbi:PaaI family thioesterase [Paraburkholderia sp. HP33-1]|uniref:PaaI family thioesterase n=1 Tax=Paraburkholderia sp. HP33-1 TaxID=2883243 RepID=UPI001F260AEF|nr:PaaI family thioesterase [Paraburkholderia sp. HP33-1]